MTTNRRKILALGGLSAAALLATPNIVQGQTSGGRTIRISGGSRNGNYTFAANALGQQIGTSLGAIEVLASDSEAGRTRGSLDNLRNLMSGTAEIGFTQSDILRNFMLENGGAQEALNVISGDFYREYVHLLVPTSSGWTRINHVGAAAGSGIIVGPDGSGAAETWRAMRKADPGLYDKVARYPDDADREALAKVAAPGSKTCLLWVSGLNSMLMQQANARAVNPKNADGKPSMQLANFDDRDIKKLAGPDGGKVFEPASIDRVKPNSKGEGGRYFNLMSGSSVDVLMVHACVVVSRKFWSSLPSSARDRIMTALDDVGPAVRQRVQPTV